MDGEYPFWKKELQEISSMICGITPDCSIIITGVPSYERRAAVESILKKKCIDYFVLRCSSRSTLRSVFYDISNRLASDLGHPYVMKSSGEAIIDIKDLSQEYFIKNNQTKSYYIILDECEQLDKELFSLLVKLPSKVPCLGVILLTVSIDPFQTNSSFIFHLPILSEADIHSVLLEGDTSETSEWVVSGIIRYFGAQTHSLSELRTMRDMALAYCRDNDVSTLQEVDECMKQLQESLFVNIKPIFTDRMESIDDVEGMIPLNVFCGVDISLNAKLLLVAGYLCSIYPESEDCKLFGRSDKATVKTKGRKRRRLNPVVKATKMGYFSIHRLLALYQNLKQAVFPELQASSTNFGLLLSQINVLSRLGLLVPVGGNSHSIDLNQPLYRCCVKRVSILNIAKNINYDITPFI